MTSISKKSMTLALCSMMALTPSLAQKPADTPVSQMEKLDRGAVLIKRIGVTNGYFLSWRLLGTDDNKTTFQVLKNGEPFANGKIYTDVTSLNVTAKATDNFQIVTLQNGQAVATTAPVTPWENAYLPVAFDRPAASSSCTYSPNDCSVGDVDGDGQYELFVKWDPSNSKDNSQGGVTGNVYLDCYKLDGTKLWRIDLGQNIRAGAHYTQFMVYDFDGDGKAELMCKTAPNSRDGAGEYVNQATDDENIKKANNTKSWLTSDGRTDGGQEYLTVFDGVTGKAINTIAYNPNRNAKSELSEAQGTFNWAVGKTDNHGYNRGERYLAAVAYLDGPDSNASAIFCRGYYAYAYVWAVDFDGSRLIPRWLHRSDSNSQYSVVTYDKSGNGR